MGSAPTRKAWNPLVSMNVSLTVDDRVDLLIRQLLPAGVCHPAQAIDRVIFADLAGCPYGLQAKDRLAPVRENEPLALLRLAQDRGCMPPEFQHRYAFHGRLSALMFKLMFNFNWRQGPGQVAACFKASRPRLDLATKARSMRSSMSVG